jgi:hypothetical protein
MTQKIEKFLRNFSEDVSKLHNNTTSQDKKFTSYTHTKEGNVIEDEIACIQLSLCKLRKEISEIRNIVREELIRFRGYQ